MIPGDLDHKIRRARSHVRMHGECTESMQGIQKWSASQRRADYKPLQGVVGTQSMLSSEYVINDEYESFYTSLSKEGMVYRSLSNDCEALPRM